MFDKHCLKSVRIRSYSGPYFPAFGLNTERCSVFLRIQSECGKTRTRITLNTDTFYALKVLNTPLCSGTHEGDVFIICNILTYSIHRDFIPSMSNLKQDLTLRGSLLINIRNKNIQKFKEALSRFKLIF